MLKVLACLLVLMGCMGYGMSLNRELRDGLWHIRYIVQILESFLSEVGFRKLSLPECCRLIADYSEEPYKTILCRIYERFEINGRSGFVSYWQEEMRKGLSKMPLSKEEKEVLIGLFEETMIYDLEMQKNLLMSRKQHMEKLLQKREREISEKRKIYTSLSFMAGLLLVLILI